MSVISPEHKAFIDDELAKLEAYNSLRPPGHVYEFHLHSVRVAESMRALSVAMNHARVEELYHAALIHDIGKRLLPIAIWDHDQKPNEHDKHERRKHTKLGVQILNDHFGIDNTHPFLALTRDLMMYHHELINGKGFLKTPGDQLSLEVRMLCICDAFDGYSTWRPHFGDRDITPKAVLERMRVEKAGEFDHDILEIFARTKNESF